MEYRQTGNIALWLERHPDLFPRHVLARRGRLSSRLGTLDLFAQYALQFFLRSQDGVESLTWYNLANMSPRARNRAYIDECWRKMREFMNADFATLQTGIVSAGFKTLAGEPDLFCWKPTDGSWFFAEAKRKDRVLEKQRKWAGVYRQKLPDAPDIKWYGLEEGP